MLQIHRFVNQLMTSNSYVVYDDITHNCLVIDPGSEKSEREISYIGNHSLQLDYIIITHEHTDHNWGVNALMAEFPNAKLVESEICSERVKKSNKMYFLFYYDDPDYKYALNDPDIVIKEDNSCILWNNKEIKFIFTPGHSFGSMCVCIENYLFTGDTIMPYKPYFNGRDSNQDDWDDSIKKMDSLFLDNSIIYPGHGGSISLGNWKKEYLNR